METENQTQETTEATPRRSRMLFYVLIPIIVVLLGVAGYMAMRMRDRTLDVASTPGGSVNLPGDPSGLQGGAEVLPEGTPTPLDQPIADHGPENWIQASWATWKPVKTDCGPVDNQTCDPSYVKQYEAGTVTEGEFKGQTIYIHEEQTLGTTYRHYVKVDGKPLFFDEANVRVRGIDDLPDYIRLPGSSQRLKRDAGGFSRYADVVKSRKIMTHEQVGDLYLTDDKGCVVALLPNGLAIAYSLEVPFVSPGSGVPQVSFMSGGANKDNYTYVKPTCGALCVWLNFVTEQELRSEQRLTVVGTTANGELVYGLKDPNDKALKDIYNDKNTVAYYSDPTPSGMEQLTNSKYTYEQFLAKHPLFYWKDALGRWVEFKNERFNPAAEMCKPVMYLYPTKPTDLGVYVAPNGGLTKTVPAYGDGWKVTAYPDGTITDRKTGLSYPYLFWEGLGLQYPEPTSGFVVETEKVSAFFDQVLPKLGLQGREISDFKEYWVARLQNTGKSYALIHFLDPKVFTALAPIRVAGPQPNTVVRVMMTAKALDEKIVLPEQKLEQAPQRAGFSFIEWGGALLQ